MEFGKLFAYKTGGDITNLENILKERGAADATVDNVINALRKDGVTMEEMYEMYKFKKLKIKNTRIHAICNLLPIQYNLHL